MKRILALCTVLLLIFALVACDGKKDDDSDKSGSVDYSITYNGQKVEVGVEIGRAHV